MNYNNVKFLTSYGNPRQMQPSEKPEIAFAGRSNVGKSSMINKIFNRKKLAKVSSMPGKTTTINFFSLENLIFADLPGYGYAKVSRSEKLRWGELIEYYFNSDRDLRLVFQLIDIRHKPTKDDIMMINFLIDNEFPFVVVLTKMDKLSTRQKKERLEALMQEIPCGDMVTMLPISSETGEGIENIKQIIEDISAEAYEEESASEKPAED